MPQPTLRPQDVVVLSKLLCLKTIRPTMAWLGAELSISASEIHGALGRLENAGLIGGKTLGGRPLSQPVLEFLLHGVRYAFPALRGGVTRGVPTSYAAPPLNRVIRGGADLPPVWPHPTGSVRGVSLEPLYPSVPVAALKDALLYEILALVDALRD